MSWRIFASSRPGLRFRERYRLRQSRGRSRLARALHVAGGSALIVVSAFFGWMPILGWGTVILGLGMIAGEFYSVARWMDWLEVRVRWLLRPLGESLARLPAWAQLSISLTIAVSTFLLVYGLYSLAFSG